MVSLHWYYLCLCTWLASYYVLRCWWLPSRREKAVSAYLQCVNTFSVLHKLFFSYVTSIRMNPFRTFFPLSLLKTEWRIIFTERRNTSPSSEVGNAVVRIRNPEREQKPKLCQSQSKTFCTKHLDTGRGKGQSDLRVASAGKLTFSYAPPCKHRKSSLEMGPGSANVLNLLSHWRET